ncbi:hypothetical protein IWW51_005809, partial [Coemansia sp. RSA 2702]
MAAETATPVEPADSSKASCIPSADVRRHISTSSQHSDHTLCNEPMAAPAARTPQAVKLGMQPQPARRASEDSASLAQAIAAGSPRVEKRPSLMQRFLGAPGAKRASPPPSVHSSASTAPRRGAGSEASTTFEQKYGTCSRECIGRGATA